MSQYILWATVGLPRSGKTVWAQSTGYPIVCPDAIRLAMHGQRFIAETEPYVWAIAHTMVLALFLAGHSQVVLDATNITKERRQAWISDRWLTYFKEFPATPEECIERAINTDRRDIISIIERMALQYEPLDQNDMCQIAGRH